MAIHFPRLSTDRIARAKWGKSWRSSPHSDLGDPAAANHAPIVVTAMLRNTVRIVATEADAARFSLRPGQTLSDARALVPVLDVHPQDRAGDADALHAIARWCIRYAPLVAIHGEDTLFIDITGCAHLFGGEQAMMDDVRDRLTAQGFAVQCAIAATPGAAHALACCGMAVILSRSEGQGVLEALPLAALRIPAETIAALNRVGFTTIGCIADLPRAPLARRFGRLLLERLDQVIGLQYEAITPLMPVPELASEKRFFDPISHQEDIEHTILCLAANIKPLLEARGLGFLACRLTLFRVDGAVVPLAISMSKPLREPSRLAALFRERIASLHDTWDAGFGFDVARLDALETGAFSSEQGELGEKVADGDDDYHTLIDRLITRLGPESVSTFSIRDSHIPERRFARTPLRHSARPAQPTTPTETQKEAKDEIPDRPLILFDRPEPIEVVAEVPDQPPLQFKWRRVLYAVVKADGPERIACEWWQDGRGAHTRDYFRVEDNQGYRFWVFRHGLYGRESGNPRWYMHGLFA